MTKYIINQYGSLDEANSWNHRLWHRSVGPNSLQCLTEHLGAVIFEKGLYFGMKFDAEGHTQWKLCIVLYGAQLWRWGQTLVWEIYDVMNVIIQLPLYTIKEFKNRLSDTKHYLLYKLSWYTTSIWCETFFFHAAPLCHSLKIP